MFYPVEIAPQMSRYLGHRFLGIVSIGYPLCSIGACGRLRLRDDIEGLCKVCLTACADLAKGCALGTVIGISNCREIQCAAQSRRSTVNWRMARRSIVAAASQNHRESNHGETRKGDPFWGLKWPWPVWPNHGGFHWLFLQAKP